MQAMCLSVGLKMIFWWMLALLVVLSVCDVGWCVLESTASCPNAQGGNLSAASDDVAPAGMGEENTISDASADFSSDWAVQVEGGAEAASILARAAGFTNMGQV